MTVEILDTATIVRFVEDEEAFHASVLERFASLDMDNDGLLSYSEMLKELQTLRVMETHFGVDMESDPEELGRVYASLFEKFDHDTSGSIDFEEFKAETKAMLLGIANDLGFVPVQMALEEDSLLKKAVDFCA